MTVAHRRAKIDIVIKRTFDIFVAAVALVLLSPLLIVAAIGIKMTSPGPIFYMAKRAGLNAHPFSMIKFRTMHVGTDIQSAITAPSDKRIFGFGNILRKLKIDELPQFWNILVGDMSVVGPRPEDPKIVDQAYTDWMRETLEVLPGVTSPGAIYGYIFGNAILDDADPEGSYVNQMLKPKLALERAYIERASFHRDIKYMILTAWAIFAHLFSLQVLLPKKDISEARRWSNEIPL